MEHLRKGFEPRSRSHGRACDRSYRRTAVCTYEKRGKPSARLPQENNAGCQAKTCKKEHSLQERRDLFLSFCLRDWLSHCTFGPQRIGRLQNAIPLQSSPHGGKMPVLYAEPESFTPSVEPDTKTGAFVLTFLQSSSSRYDSCFIVNGRTTECKLFLSKT